LPTISGRKYTAPAKLAERERFGRAVRFSLITHSQTFCSVAWDFCLRGDSVAILQKQKAARLGGLSNKML
jgi:hypothetical protein